MKKQHANEKMSYKVFADEINRRHRNGESVDQIKKELGVSFSIVWEALGWKDEFDLDSDQQ